MNPGQTVWYVGPRARVVRSGELIGIHPPFFHFSPAVRTVWKVKKVYATQEEAYRAKHKASMVRRRKK